MSKRQQWVAVLGLSGAGLALVGVVSVAKGALSKPQPAPAAAASGVFRPTKDQWAGLTLQAAEPQGFEELESADGRIESDGDHTTQVASPFTGRVLEVFAQAGQTVSRKTPLFAVAANEVAQGRSDLAGAQAALVTAEAQAKLAKDNEARQAELYKSAGGALKDWRQAQSDAIAAEGQVQTAKASVAAAEGKLQVLGQGDAKTGADMAKAVVYAPADGVVIRRALGPGQNLTAGGDALFAISDLKTVWLTAQLRETDAAKVQVGSRIEVTTPAFPGRVFEAKLSYVAPALDESTRRLPVRAELANPGGLLKPGMFARFRIASKALGSSPAVPETAVLRDGDSARVWVASADGALRLRPVTVGAVENGQAQITGGLRPGEKVVVKGALFVDQAGQPD